MKFRLLSLFACLLAHSACAETLFSSYPKQNTNALSISQSQAVGVSFVPAFDEFQLTALTAPFSFFGDPPSTPSQPLKFELWTSHLVDIGGGTLRQRPDSLLGSWTTAPVAKGGASTFPDVEVAISDGPILAQAATYWFLVRAGWSGLDPDTHVRWAASESHAGFGYGERMMTFNPNSGFPFGNIDPGDFVAFKVSGSNPNIPEPTTALLFAVGMFGLCNKRRRAESVF